MRVCGCVGEGFVQLRYERISVCFFGIFANTHHNDMTHGIIHTQLRWTVEISMVNSMRLVYNFWKKRDELNNEIKIYVPICDTVNY